MRFLIIVMMFLVGCSKTIQTPNGEVKLDSSYESSVFSKDLIETKIESYTKSCTKCGMCFTMGKFKYSCMCSGRKNMVSKFSYFSVIYKYTSKKNPDMYRTTPRTTRELIESIKHGRCQ